MVSEKRKKICANLDKVSQYRLKVHFTAKYILKSCCFATSQASLVVNVASHSEKTEANYRSLQELHRELGTSHFNVLAFPCGQYGDTEPGTSRDIETLAKSTYGVTFPFFSKIKIMGSEAEPAFKYLTGRQTNIYLSAALCVLLTTNI